MKDKTKKKERKKRQRIKWRCSVSVVADPAINDFIEKKKSSSSRKKENFSAAPLTLAFPPLCFSLFPASP